MASYTPPRGADGKIIVGPLPVADLLDEEESPAPPAAAPAPPAPPRRPGDTPTAFAQLRPGPAAPPARAAGGWLSYVAALAVVALLALAVVALRGQASPAPAAAAVASEAPTGSPAARLPRAMLAYGAPDGAPMSALDSGRPYAVVGRSGDGWLQLDVGEPKPVWVRAWDGAAFGAVPDLATPTPEPTATPVPYTPAYVPLPDPAYVAPSPVPQATCKAVILDGQEIGQACGYTQADLMATNTALLSTPRGGVPVQIVTRTPLDPSKFPTPKR